MKDSEKEDSKVSEFLSFLAHDMQANPSHIHGFSSTMQDRAKALTSKLKIDLDKPLFDVDSES